MDNLGKCIHCNEKLKAFTKKTDWDSRKLHKTCWKKLEEAKSHKLILEQYLKDNNM